MRKIIYLLVYASNAQFTDSRDLCSTNQFCNEFDNLGMSANCGSGGLSCTSCPKNYENLKQNPDDYRCTAKSSNNANSGMNHTV